MNNIDRKLFLFSNNAENFEKLLKNFVNEVNGGVIAFCHVAAPGWEPYFEEFRALCLKLGASDAVSVHPEKDTSALSDEAIQSIRKADGIFVTGGNTLEYWKVYCKDEPVKTILRDRYFSGVPYAGLSAGSMITADKVYCEEEGLTTVEIGLEFLSKVLIIPHFTEWNMFNTLIKDVNIVEAETAFGIDETCMLEFTDEKLDSVHGERCFVFTRKNENEFSLKILKDTIKTCEMTKFV